MTFPVLYFLVAVVVETFHGFNWYYFTSKECYFVFCLLQLFLHRVFGYRGILLFPWLARLYDRDIAGNKQERYLCISGSCYLLSFSLYNIWHLCSQDATILESALLAGISAVSGAASQFWSPPTPRPLGLPTVSYLGFLLQSMKGSLSWPLVLSLTSPGFQTFLSPLS